MSHFVCACAVALACVSVTAFADDSGKTIDFDTPNHIDVQKTFSGIDANQIPSDFAITVKGDKVTYTLTSADASKNGLTWSWTINDAKAGTYTLSESGEAVAHHTVSTSGLNASGKVAPGSATITVLDRISRNNVLSYNWRSGQIFLAALTANGQEGTAVISDYALSADVQAAITSFLNLGTNEKGLPNDFKGVNVTFGTISDIQSTGEAFDVDGRSFAYIDGQIVVGKSCDISQVAWCSLQITEPQNPSFAVTNAYTYHAKGNVTLSIVKDINGRDWRSTDEFKFALYKNTKDGKVQVDTIKTAKEGSKTVSFVDNYDESDIGKTYNYVIEEVELESLPKNIIPGNPVEVSVEVTDNGDGTLTATPTYKNGQSIINTYSAKVPAIFEAAKQLEGRNWKDGEFYVFTLYNENDDVVKECKVNANGTVTFEGIEFTEQDLGKTYRYTIDETSKLPGGMTKSGLVEAFVTITDEDEDGELEVNIQYVTDNMTIVNSYKADPTQVNLVAQKNLEGAELEDGQFFFSVYMNGEVVATASNDANGLVAFPAIKFEKADSYDLLVKEQVVESDENIKYDLSEIPVHVEVVDDGEGNLIATVFGTESLVFNNEYVEDFEDPNDEPADDNGDGEKEHSPKTGDSNPMALFLLLLVAGASGTAIGARKMRCE